MEDGTTRQSIKRTQEEERRGFPDPYGVILSAIGEFLHVAAFEMIIQYPTDKELSLDERAPRVLLFRMF